MKIKKYLPLLLSVCVLCSCLDENPSYTTNSQNVFKSQSSAQMALNTIYGQMASQGTFAQLIAEINSDCSGLTWAVYDGADNRSQYTAGYIPVENEFNDLVWNGLYKAISNCNLFIENMNQSTSTWTTKDNMIAQAYFLRGVCYFHLLSFYGGVPLRVSPTTTETVSVPRASRQEVIDQIINDWTFARVNLSKNMEQASGAPTAPCKYSVDAYLAKLYWLMGCHAWAAEQGDKWATGVLKDSWKEMKSSAEYFNLAKTYGDSVLQAQCFDLEPSLKTLFGGKRVAFSKEFIFVVDATMNTTNNVAYNSLHWTFSPQNSSQGITWARSQPNKSWYDYCRGTYQDDPRLKITFNSAYPTYTSEGVRTGNTAYTYPLVTETKKDTIGYHFVDTIINKRPIHNYKVWDVVSKTIVSDSINYAQCADPTNPDTSELSDKFKKSYCDMSSGQSYQYAKWPVYWKHYTNDCTGRYANNNLYIYRYSDFLLLMADVYNELNQPTKALEMVNKVLTRARHSGTEAATTESVYPKNWQASMSKDDIRLGIFHERLFELVAEFDGFNDSRRRGITWRRTLLERSNNHHITAASYASSKRINYAGNSREYWYPNYGAYDESADWDTYMIRNQLLPIPRNELSTNDKMSFDTSQNPYYN